MPGSVAGAETDFHALTPFYRRKRCDWTGTEGEPGHTDTPIAPKESP